ncbi:ABC transporter related protein [Russula earlei]|uniref:ABC transporter related protein n=1 Tax=Russula earlei TaxID=71964 RepID=A0ACC0TWD5_9AGAM|nr:ABC transporter related protein [Russula earlei]
MISIQNVSKSFGSTIAVNDISFEVKEGENFILIGTSGCGKTTTLRLINRLLEPDKGTIIVNGKNVFAEKPEILRRGIGYVLQNNSLFPHYTVRENIGVVPGLLQWDKNKTGERVNELVDKLQLQHDWLDKYPSQLSGGQQQRVNIARALAAYPPVLLMDEPFGALDAITRTAIRKEFAHLDELTKKTIVMVTHDIAEAIELGNTICLMNNGKIVQVGTPAQLLNEPATEFVKDFFANYKLTAR